jgi:hypothetical protein
MGMGCLVLGAFALVGGGVHCQSRGRAWFTREVPKSEGEEALAERLVECGRDDIIAALYLFVVFWHAHTRSWLGQVGVGTSLQTLLLHCTKDLLFFPQPLLLSVHIHTSHVCNVSAPRTIPTNLHPTPIMWMTRGSNSKSTRISAVWGSSPTA